MSVELHPRGPLEVSEVTKKTAHLSWKMPEDDGGRQIMTYEVNRQSVLNRIKIPEMAIPGIHDSTYFVFFWQKALQIHEGKGSLRIRLLVVVKPNLAYQVTSAP